MKKRTLGKSGLEVSAIGLGCMGMSTSYGVFDDDAAVAESVATIRHAIDRGVTFFDTSDAYGAGRNEELLGRAVKGRRDRVVIATKFGNVRRAATGRDVIGDPAYVPKACEASLKRLDIEAIDLWYQHRVDPTVPIEDTVGAMARMVEQGKVRFLGLSEAGPETIRRAHATHPITALQSEYSLWTRDHEAEILPLCRRLGIGFVAYSPLGRGFLTATIKKPGDMVEKDRRHEHPRFTPENIERNLSLVAVVERVAAAKDCAPAQVALAWVLARGEDIVPIPGTKRRQWLDVNVAAVGIALSADELAALDDAFRPGVTAGARYPQKQLAGLGI